MEHDRIEYLLNRYETGTLTLKEWAELGALAADETHKETILAYIDRTWQSTSDPDVYQHTVMNEETILRNIRRQTRPRYIRMLHPWGWVAASVLLLLGASLYFSQEVKQQHPATAAAAEIAPGREGAILTLADGTEVMLDTIANGIAALQGGTAAKVANGGLIYEGHSKNAVYNTMTTPKGRQFRLTLPDGSKVWLNAASSIRYPTAFNGTERRVRITGEAYFEIAPNAKAPFRVDIDNRGEVEVLGTQFNINAYDNENKISTTLLEGAVKVRDQSGNAILQPGQQAQMEGNGIKVIKKVDTGKIIAWKNGLFNFDGLGLEEVMRQLERWYNIDVVYEEGIPDIKFGGKLTRGMSLGDLLLVLEKSDVHFRLEQGRKLIVTH